MIILKVGNRVQGNDCGYHFSGTVYEITGENCGTIKRDDLKHGNGCYIPGYGQGWSFTNLINYSLELINTEYPILTSGTTYIRKVEEALLKDNKDKLTMKEKFVQMFLKEPERSFRKAGITNGDGFLTGDGKDLFLTYLLSKNGDTFKKEVVDGLLEEEAKKNK